MKLRHFSLFKIPKLFLISLLLLIFTKTYAATIQLFDNTTQITNGQAQPIYFVSLPAATVPIYPTVTKTFTVKNIGADTLNITALTTTGSRLFLQPSTASTSVLPEGSVTFDVVFDTSGITPAATNGVSNTIPLVGVLPTPNTDETPIVTYGTVQVFSNDTANPLFSFPIMGVTTTVGGSDFRLLKDQQEVLDAQASSAAVNRVIDFGSVPIGKAVSKTFTVINVGNTAADFPADAVTLVSQYPGTPADVFSVSMAPTNLAPGAITDFTVTLNASTADVFGALIRVGSTSGDFVNAAMLAAGSPVSPAVAATGFPATFDEASTFAVFGHVTPLPVIKVLDGATDIPNNTGVVDFGQLFKGDTANTRTFTVENLGGLVLNLQNPITLTNTAGNGFSLVSSTFPKTAIAANTGSIDSTTFQVELDTDQLGTFEASVTFSHDDQGNQPFNFKFKGVVVGNAEQEIEIWQGTAAEVMAGTALPLTDLKPGEVCGDKNTILFDTTVGNDVTKVFTVRNTGGVDLGNMSLNLPLPDKFTLASPFPSKVAPGGTESFSLKLDGQVEGLYGGELNIFNDDKANPGDNDGVESPFNFCVTADVHAPAPEIQVLDDTGTDIDIEIPTQINFGKKPRGTNVPKIFTVKNIGDNALTLISPATLTGTGFSVASFTPGLLQPGATANFTVTLDASVPGTFNAEIAFTNDDKDEALFKFPVTAIVDDTPPDSQFIEVWYGSPADITAGTAVPIKDGTATTSGTAIDLTPEGNVTVGTPLTKIFTVRNAGSQVLNLFGAPPVGGIQVIGTLPFVVPAVTDGQPGQITFEVQVDTSVASKKGGTFQLFNNDGTQTPFDFPITATVGDITPPPAEKIFTVTVKGTGSVDSTAPAGIGITDCTVAGGTNCTAELPAETTNVTLTAKGGVVTWSGPDCKAGATADTAIVTVGATATTVACTADFSGAEVDIPLAVKVTGIGSVDSTTPTGIGIVGCTAEAGTCQGQVPAETASVLLTAHPPIGTTVAWGPGCTAGSEVNTGQVAITSETTAVECTVAFTAGTVVVDMPLTVAVIGNGSVDSVIPTQLGIKQCTATGGTCQANLAASAATVVLSAKPVAGETVTWRGDCSGTGYTGVIAVAADTTVLACAVTFEDLIAAKPEPELELTIVGEGQITKEPAGAACTTPKNNCSSYFQGDSVALTAVASPNAKFSSWGGDCSDQGNKSLILLKMDDDKACTATFVTSVETQLLTIEKNGSGTGQVVSENQAIDCGATCTANIPQGNTVKLTATEAADAVFAGWGGDCASFAAGNPAVVTLDTAKACTATFNAKSQEADCFEQGGILLSSGECKAAPALTATSTGATTDALIRGGISVQSIDGYGPYVQKTTVTALATQAKTAGIIKVEPVDVGKSADVVVVGRQTDPDNPTDTAIWYMLVGCPISETCPLGWNIGVEILPVDEQAQPILSKLRALKKGVTLSNYLPINMYEGTFFYPSHLEIFFGYRIEEAGNIKIVFDATPIDIMILPQP